MKIGRSKLTLISDTILVPTWLHFSSQNPPKSSQSWFPRGFNFLIDFDIDFSTIWGPTWCHLGSQVGPMLAAKSHKNRSRSLPRRTWEEESAQTPSGLRFWLIFGRFLIDFWSIFDRFVDRSLNYFRSIHDQFWNDFWSIFERFYPSLDLLFISCSSAVAGTQLCCALDNF